MKALFKTSLKGLVFEVAKAWTVEDFAAAIEKIKAINVAAGNFLENIDRTKWARALFPAQRLGHVTSNMSESMNKWLEQVRHLCPVEIFESYIEKLNILFEKKEEQICVHSTTFPSPIRCTHLFKICGRVAEVGCQKEHTPSLQSPEKERPHGVQDCGLVGGEMHMRVLR